MVSRRRTLHLAGTGLFGLAGCLGGDAPAGTGTNDGTPTATPSTTPTDSPNETPPSETGIEVDGASPAWSRSFDESVLTDPVYADGHVVLVVGTTVYGIDAESGETAWTFESPVSPEGDYGRPTATLRRHADTVYALVGTSVGTGAHDHVLHALTPDGRERWTYESRVDGFHDLVGFGDGTVVLGTSDDAIGAADSGGHVTLAVNLADGSERWRTETSDVMGGRVGDEVAAVRVNGGIDCLDLATGDRRFRFAPDADGRLAATAVGGGRVFAALLQYEGEAPTMYALSAADGTEDWTIDGTVVTSLRYLDDLYVGGEYVSRFAPDGTERWAYDGGGLISRVPFDTDALYTNASSRVVKLDRETGEERWGTDATDLAIPRARGGDAVVSSDGQAQMVFAHSVADGGELWHASLSGEYPPSPAAGGGGAYLATAGGDVVKVPLVGD